MTKALDKAIARLEPGSRWLVVDHTWLPSRKGSIRTVIEQRTVRRFTVRATDQKGYYSDMELPATGLRWIDEDTFVYPIGRKREDGKPHTVTLRALDVERNGFTCGEAS